jgi:hypothetical protein
MFVVKLYTKTKIVAEKFLRNGTCTMFENEKNSFDGYAKFFKMAQTK